MHDYLSLPQSDASQLYSLRRAISDNASPTSLRWEGATLFTFTPDDLACLRSYATAISDEEVREETIGLLQAGIESYVDDDLLEKFHTLGNLLEKRGKWFLENRMHAGKTSEEAFNSPKGRLMLQRLVIGMNVPPGDIDDLVQDIVIKFWRHNHAEKYNPFKSPWVYHVKSAVRTCVITYSSVKKRSPTQTGFFFQQYKGNSNQVDEIELEPYEVEQEPAPAEKMDLQVFLEGWEQFLSKETPFRTEINRGYKEICLVDPLLIQGSLFDVPTTYYVVAKGRKNIRVTHPTWTDNRTILVPIESLIPQLTYSPQNPGIPVHAVIIDNPDHKQSVEPSRVERTPLIVYGLLKEGLQVDQIAARLRVGSSTAHNWIRLLEELFRKYWLVSDLVPEEIKYLAVPTYKCSCRKIFHSKPLENKCTRCGNVVSTEKITRLKTYPWNPVRGSKDIADRSAKYRPTMQAPLCSM